LGFGVTDLLVVRNGPARGVEVPLADLLGGPRECPRNMLHIRLRRYDALRFRVEGLGFNVPHILRFRV
jgi:hypothetical protein